MRINISYRDELLEHKVISSVVSVCEYVNINIGEFVDPLGQFSRIVPCGSGSFRIPGE